jgi:membrane protease YdiL (CAAX protease family)
MSKDSSSAEAAPAKKPAENRFKAWPWGPAAGIIVTALAFVLSQLVAGGVFLLVFAAMGWSFDRMDKWLSTVSGQFLAVLLSEGLVLLCLWLFLRSRKANWRLLGFLRSPVLRDVWKAVLGFVIYFTLLLVIGGLATSLLHINLDQKQELGFDKVVGSADKIIAFVSLVLLPPFVEETLFRGFLFTGLRKKLPFVGAAIFTSLLFAAPHLTESSSGPLWIAGIDTFLLSLVLCYLREKTGALWSSIAVHLLKNGVAFLYLYVFVGK